MFSLVWPFVCLLQRVLLNKKNKKQAQDECDHFRVPTAKNITEQKKQKQKNKTHVFTSEIISAEHY